MADMLPLFPLGTVLCPGQVLPLHIFEDRYRQLMSDLLADSEPHVFGVIAIRTGRETGIDGIAALYDTGCTATLREVRRHDDGQLDIVTVGTRRFVLTELDSSGAYLRGQVRLLTEEAGDEAAAALAARAVRQAFRGYLDVLAARCGTQINCPELPTEPVLLSYLVAASMIVDLPDRQRLLAEPDALRRLIAERQLLSRETAMLRALPSTPASELGHSSYSPN
jgi:Lon protease-like protein